MVYFEDNFWGEKNNGYDVLYHNMKHGMNASRELADFVRDRASVEEVYAKSLSKICKPTIAALGTFEPCWAIIKNSTEILVNSHNQVVHKLQELVKSIKDYGELQKESQKNLKDDLTATSEVVNLIQTKTAAVAKAKDIYYARSQEFEKVKKETTNAKDIEKAEQKKIRAGEEYKNLVEKREEIRKSFHEKMIETAKKFEDVELGHLKKMSEYLLSYVAALASSQEPVQKVTAHFRTQVEELTSDKLLAQFVKTKGTGRNVPDEIFFEEFAVVGSLVELEVIESPNINTRAQSISGFRKKKKDKDKEKEKEKERKEKKTKKKKEKTQTPNGTLTTDREHNSSETSATAGDDRNVGEPEVDEEGYRIIPKDAESTKSHESASDSDTSDDEDEPKKFVIKIKPETEKTTASLDEFRSIQLTLPTPSVWQKKNESTSSDSDFSKTSVSSDSSVQSSQKFSKSQEDLLSIDFSQKSFGSPPTKQSTTLFNATQLNAFNSPGDDQNYDVDKSSVVDADKPPELAPKKRTTLRNDTTSSPALPPKKFSTLSGSTGSLPDTISSPSDTSDDSHNPLSFLAPPPSDLARSTSSGSTSSRPRPKPRYSTTPELSSSISSTKAPIRTYGSPTSATTTSSPLESSYSSDLLANIKPLPSSSSSSPIDIDNHKTQSKTIWDRLNSPSNQHSVRNILPPSGGPILKPTVANIPGSQVSAKKPEDLIPVAVALVETISAHLKGKESSKTIVNGDITVSFPASAISSLASNNPPVLSFAITGSSSLENILPNKALITSEEQSSDEVDVRYFIFKMPSLLAHLKKLADQGQAPYYNIDILKYQVHHSKSLTPLAVSCYWKCEEKVTDVRVDYQYSPAARSVCSTLNNVSFIVPVDGGVEIMQSKPIAKWSKDHQKVLWQIPEISSNSESQGCNTLRARFDLKTGPSNPHAAAVQFQCNGSTLSNIDFQLNTDMYKLSLVKRKIVTGKYLADPRLMTSGM